jgi:hypothetical protein
MVTRHCAPETAARSAEKLSPRGLFENIGNIPGPVERPQRVRGDRQYPVQSFRFFKNPILDAGTIRYADEIAFDERLVASAALPLNFLLGPQLG